MGRVDAPSGSGEPPVSVDPDRDWPPISYWARVTVIVLAVLAGFALLWQLRGIALLLVVSLMLAVGLQPLIRWLEQKGLRRGWALALILVTSLLVIIGFGVVMIPFLVDQVATLVAEVPEFIERLQSSPGIVGTVAGSLNLETLLEEDAAESSGGPALSVVSTVGGAIFSVVTVLAITPYLAIRFPQLKVWVARLLRPRNREDFLYVMGESTDLVANYIVGNAVVSLIAGTVAFTGFQVMGVKFGLVLAVWIAFTDLIPAVGAFLGIAGAALVAAFQSPGTALTVIIFLAVYQLLENFVIAPRVMNRAIDLSPVAVILAILVGGIVAGVVGALLALPVVAMLKIVVFELLVPERLNEIRRNPRADKHPRRRQLP